APNRQSIGFFAGAPTTLKRIDVTGGSVQTLSTIVYMSAGGMSGGSRLGGAWSQNGVILFAPNVNTPLYRIPVNGGEAVPVTRLDPPRQLVHLFPQFLPDGNHFLFFADGNAEGHGVYVGSLESPEGRRLFDSDGPAVFMPL